MDPILLLNPILQLCSKSAPRGSPVQQSQPLPLDHLPLSGGPKASPESHQDPEVGVGPASSLAREHPPAHSTHRWFIGHGRWLRPSTPLRFIKKKEEKQTNRSHTGTTHVAQGSKGSLCPVVLVPGPLRVAWGGFGAQGSCWSQPRTHAQCSPAALGWGPVTRSVLNPLLPPKEGLHEEGLQPWACPGAGVGEVVTPSLTSHLQVIPGQYSSHLSPPDRPGYPLP